MLVLSRKRNEKIFLPEVGVTIMVTDAQQGRARIGIEAPSHVRVIREEIMEEADAAMHLQQIGNSSRRNSA